MATPDSIHIKGGIDACDLMDRFSEWCMHGAYTPFQENFDIGISTSQAIRRYAEGTDPFECGGTAEGDNGNGSLMRILPVCLYLYERQKKICTSENEAVHILHKVSALTHGHIRSQMACGIYYFLVKSILEGTGTLIDRLQKGMDQALSFYRQDFRNYTELGSYDRLNDLRAFQMTPEDEISSSGYVVHTLEASIWCLLNTDSYEQAVLKAVNLGADTDTVGAVAGGLAGLFYGYAQIPSEWLETIRKREWVEQLIRNE
ncbi:MAG: ADP-ribosylglycohydrolase family protein [Lachnospiraceae bacterium]|nr:ADP-ribosylglycohydrolase family protein [Lachnospiraceae bacterium]